MAGDRQERVYISVETTGIDQAVKDIQKLLKPLESLKVSGGSGSGTSSQITAATTAIAVQEKSAAAQLAKDLTVTSGKIIASTTTQSAKLASEIAATTVKSVIMASPEIARDALKEITPMVGDFFEDTIGIDPKDLTKKFAPLLDQAKELGTHAVGISLALEGAAGSFAMISKASKGLAPLFLFLKGYNLVKKAADSELAPAKRLLQITSATTTAIKENVRLQLEAAKADQKALTAKQKLKDVYEGIVLSAQEYKDIYENLGYRQPHASKVQKAIEANKIFGARSQNEELTEGIFSKLGDKSSNPVGGYLADCLQTAVNNNAVLSLAGKVGKSVGATLWSTIKTPDDKYGFVDFFKDTLDQVSKEIALQAPHIAAAMQMALKGSNYMVSSDEAKFGFGQAILDVQKTFAKPIAGESQAKSLLSDDTKQFLLKGLDDIKSSALKSADAFYMMYRNAVFAFNQKGAGAAFGTVLKDLATTPIGTLIGPLTQVGKLVGQLALKLLANPVGIAAAAITAIVAATGFWIKSNIEALKVYDELNPSIRTACDSVKEMTDENEALGMAVDSVFGETFNNLVLPIVDKFTGFVTLCKTEISKLWVSVWEGGPIVDQVIGDLKLLVVDFAGTALEAFSSLMPDKLLKKLGLDKVKEKIATLSYDIRSERDKAFDGSLVGERFYKELDKARAKVKEKTEEDAKELGKSTATLIKNEFEGVFDGYSFIDVDGELKLFKDDIYKQMEDAKEAYYGKLSALTDGFLMDDQTRAELRIKIEEEYNNKIRQLEVENATATNNWIDQVDDLYRQNQIAKENAAREAELLAEQEHQQKLKEIEEQRIAETAAAEKAAADKRKAQLEWTKEYLTGPISSGISDILVSAMEGEEDLGSLTFDLMYSIAKNIFTNSISELINAGLMAIMNQYESNSKLGLPGLAIATVASGAITAIMAAMKSKMQAPTKMSAQVGGYVSSGFVRGAYSSGDSVSAYLQPGERVLSKEETKAYDENMNKNNNIVVNVTINGQLSTQSQIDTTVREALIPSIRRAVMQGYSLGV